MRVGMFKDPFENRIFERASLFIYLFIYLLLDSTRGEGGTDRGLIVFF